MFVPGVELCRGFYQDVVAPLVPCAHSAALIGFGSQVLGYDTERSTDHGWGPRVEVFVDGGVRRGTDVLRAVALGARAVLIGRPCLWGLAANGEAGVTRVFDMLRAELTLAMALSGAPSVADITPDLVTVDRR